MESTTIRGDAVGPVIQINFSGVDSSTVVDCLRIRNGGQAGILIDYGSPIVLNVTDGGGGGVAVSECAAPVFSGSTVAAHLAGEQGGGTRAVRGSHPHLQNCILWGNDASEGVEFFADDSSSALVECCDHVELQAHGPGTAILSGWNCWQDPLCCEPDSDFCNPHRGEFTLHSDSPCAPGNSPDCGLIGAWPADCCPFADAPDVASPPEEISLRVQTVRPFRLPAWSIR